jgi:hypothetical protein
LWVVLHMAVFYHTPASLSANGHKVWCEYFRNIFVPIC